MTMENADAQVGRSDPPGGRWNKTDLKRWGRLLLFGLLGAGGLAFAVFNTAELIRQHRLDSRFAPHRTISLEEPRSSIRRGAPPQLAADSSLRLAVAPIISPEKSLQTYRGLVDYLAEALDREPVFLQGGSYEQINDLLRNHQCDIAMVCTYAFIRGNKEFGMEALLIPVIQGQEHYHSYILVPRSSRATSLLDLRGKRFGFANRLSNSGWLYPMVWLEQRGEDAETFFQGNHVMTGSHDRSVRQVASEYLDGAAVDSLVYEQMVEEDPSLAKETKKIEESQEFGMPPVVVPPQIEPGLKHELLRILLEMHADAEGKKILTSLRIDRFVRPREGLFDGVRKYAEYLESRR